jgi:signal transduction histidine kinase
MRSPRSTKAAGAAHPDRTDRLVAQTQRRLAAFTLLLVTALLVGVGVATALVATRLMDTNVDRALEAAAAAVTQPSEDGGEAVEAEHQPRSADTFVLLVDARGTVLANPNGVPVQELPDTAALDAAAQTGRDIRSGTYGGIDIRLLTLPAPASGGEEGGGSGGQSFVQAGFVLTLHEQQESQLMWTIAIVSLAGLAGAALVTLLVTRRALVPIRAAFATERRFVAAASHELRTPVAIVRASAEILEREQLVAADGQPFVADIVSETDRMGRLVGDLLALASAEAGAIDVQLHRMDLVVWLSDLGRRAESMAGAHGLTLSTSVPDQGTVPVDADEDRLTQLVFILVDNAIEHSPSGGGITLGLAVTGGKAVVSVSDQGPGVPAAERERIFEPFARLPRERRSATGSGLGLAIARQLAGRHDGDMLVEDAPGGGARFALRLPLRSSGLETVPV